MDMGSIACDISAAGHRYTVLSYICLIMLHESLQ